MHGNTLSLLDSHKKNHNQFMTVYDAIPNVWSQQNKTAIDLHKEELNDDSLIKTINHAALLHLHPAKAHAQHKADGIVTFHKSLTRASVGILILLGLAKDIDASGFDGERSASSSQSSNSMTAQKINPEALRQAIATDVENDKHLIATLIKVTHRSLEEKAIPYAASYVFEKPSDYKKAEITSMLNDATEAEISEMISILSDPQIKSKHLNRLLKNLTSYKQSKEGTTSTAPAASGGGGGERKEAQTRPHTQANTTPLSSAFEERMTSQAAQAETPLKSLAKIIASNSEYIEFLLNLTTPSSWDLYDYMGQTDKIKDILETINIEQLELLPTTISNPKDKAAVEKILRDLIPAQKPSAVVAPVSSTSQKPNTAALLAGHKQYDLDGIGKVARFNVAPLGDCGLLSLPGTVSRAQATQLIERALVENRFHSDDAAYLRDQHHHLTVEGQSLQQKHLKLIGLTLGFNVRFFFDVDGMLIEATDIEIKSTRPGLKDALVFDGEGHFETLIPVTDTEALRRAYETEQTSKKATADFQRKYQ